jgi:uncharacterized membrane protein YdjX (TVP38/TMEM64 family)
MDVRNKRLVWILVTLVVLGGAIGFLALRMNLGDHVKRCLDYVRAEGAGMFFVAMAVLPLCGFPLSAFILSAGPVFAPSLGPSVVIACGMGALAFNVSLSYWFAAFGLRPWMERVIIWLGYQVPKLPAGREWEFNLVLRVVPGVPFFVQNYVLGLARVRFGIYMLVAMTVPSAYLMIAVLAGDALAQGDQRKLMIAGVLFAVVGAILHVLRKRLVAKRALARASVPADRPTQTEA